MPFATVAESRPRFFWYTTPSWLQMNDITPEAPQRAGYATSAKPPIICPFAM